MLPRALVSGIATSADHEPDQTNGGILRALKYDAVPRLCSFVIQLPRSIVVYLERSSGPDGLEYASVCILGY